MIAKATDRCSCRGRETNWELFPAIKFGFVPRPASCRSSAGNPAADPSALALSTVVYLQKAACMPRVTGDPFRPSQQSV